MGALSDVTLANEAGPLVMVPQSNRNGLVKWLSSGAETSAEGIGTIQMTLSTRQGRPADLVRNLPRIRRKVTAKIQIPIDVPVTETETRTDVIDLNVEFTVPIDATAAQFSDLEVIQVALMNENTHLLDAVRYGYEPY